jgi:hypothetical protein
MTAGRDTGREQEGVHRSIRIYCEEAEELVEAGKGALYRNCGVIAGSQRLVEDVEAIEGDQKLPVREQLRYEF